MAAMDKAAKASVAELLKDCNAEWTQRRDALVLIRKMALSDSHSKEAILSCLTDLQPFICAQLEDRRSIYCKEVCELITSFATRLEDSFESLSVDFITALFPLLVVTIRVIAESAYKCILSLLPFSISAIPIISQGIKDKHPVLRARCTEYMCRLLETTSKDKLNSAIYLEAIDDSIRSAIADSSADARALAKRSYQAYNKRFPDQAQKLFSSLDTSLQNRLVEAKPAPKKGGFADFLAKKQAAKANNNIDCGVLVQDAVVISKTGDDNNDEGNNQSSSPSSGSSSPTLSSSSSSSASSTTSTSLSPSNTSPATQSHSLTVDVITISTTEIITTEPEKNIVVPVVLPVSEQVIVEAVAETTVSISTPEPTPVEVVETVSAPVVEAISSSMDVTPRSPSPSPSVSSSPSTPTKSTESIEPTEAPATTVSSPVEAEIETKPTSTSHAEPELAVLPDESQSSSVDESRPALSELLSETTERLPSPLSDRRSLDTEEKSASPEPTKPTKTTTKAPTKTTSATTKSTTTSLKSAKPTNSPTLSSTSRPALRSMTNVSKASTTTLTKEPVKKPATTLTTTTTTNKAPVSKKRTTYSLEDKENQQDNIIRSASTEPKPAKKLRVSAPSDTSSSIAARVKTTRRAAAVVATSTLVRSSSSSSLPSKKSTTTVLKSKTTTKRPWL